MDTDTHIYIGRKRSINSLLQSSIKLIKLIRTLPYYICAWNCEYVRTQQHVCILGKFRTRHQKVSQKYQLDYYESSL